MFKALFIILKAWKQPKCPSTDEWIKKMGYTYTHTHTHTMDYPALKKKEILSFGTTWINLGEIMPSKINQAQKDKFYIISVICGN